MNREFQFGLPNFPDDWDIRRPQSDYPPDHGAFHQQKETLDPVVYIDWLFQGFIKSGYSEDLLNRFPPWFRQKLNDTALAAATTTGNIDEGVQRALDLLRK